MERIIFLRPLPERCTPPVREGVYFVEITNESRSLRMNSPSSRSLAPSPYRLAVSMKLPPALAKPSKMPRLSSALDPNERGSPKVMAPKHNSETRSPLAPNVTCFMVRGFSLLASCCERPESGYVYEGKLNNPRERA